MTVEINLLRKHKTSKFTQKAIFAIRLTTLILGAVVLLSLSGLFLLRKNLELQLDAKTAHHNQIMSRIAKSQEKETAAILLNEKYKAIDALLKAEPPYVSYYQTLMKELPNSSDSGRLTNLSIHKTGIAIAQIHFPNILAMTKFMTRVESNEFQKNFTSVRTSGITFGQDGSKEVAFSIDVKF